MSQQNNSNGRHVFISYSNKQRQYARQYADHLIREGFEVWIDDQIEYGNRWWRAIVKAISECAAFTVIMTPDSDESDWVQKEVMFALDINKPIYPVLLAGEKWPLLNNLQYSDVRDGNLPATDFVEQLAKVAPRQEKPAQLLELSRQFEFLPKIVSSDNLEADDDMYAEAVALVKRMNKASISLLQRRLRIGYTRAARLIDLMAQRGVISADAKGSDGSRNLTSDAEDSRKLLP